jgi:hypothetical protein
LIRLVLSTKSFGGEAGSHLTELQQHFLEEPEPYRHAAPAAAVPALPELLVVVYVICTDDGTVLQKRKIYICGNVLHF